MRFCLKWLLAGMVYAAIAAAAFAKPHWAYADILWGVTLLAFAYAALLTCYRRGKAQARSVGFVVVSLCILVCLYVAPDALPTRRILDSLGVFTTQIVIPPAPPQPASGAIFQGLAGSPSGGTLVFSPAAPTPITTNQLTDEALVKLRAANAIATMLAGLAGSVLGIVAYRRGGEN